MLNPLKSKYFDLYWDIAFDAANQSKDTHTKVGAVVVTPTGMLSIGWNGMPAGMSNRMRNSLMQTKPEVIHAERNAIDKMTRQGVPTDGSILFVTHSPCLECAKAIHGLGFAQIRYAKEYRCTDGIKFLIDLGLNVNHDPDGKPSFSDQVCVALP